MNPIKTEPAMVMALVEAVIALVTSFGLQLSGEQVGAIMALAAVLTGWFLRSQVTPTANLPPAEQK